MRAGTHLSARRRLAQALLLVILTVSTGLTGSLPQPAARFAGLSQPAAGIQIADGGGGGGTHG